VLDVAVLPRGWLVNLDSLASGVLAQRFRRYAILSKERAAHSFAVQKTRFPRDHVNWVSLLFHHEPRSLQAKLFNSLCGRLTAFGQKGAAELTRAKARDGCQFLDGEVISQVLADVDKNRLDATRFWHQVKKYGMLVLTSHPALVDDKKSQGKHSLNRKADRNVCNRYTSGHGADMAPRQKSTKPGLPPWGCT
jgi:hypothetical protein